VVVARDGAPLRAFPVRIMSGGIRSRSAMSHRCIGSLIAYEDKVRWHPGVNPLALTR
jgi:membrane carboxypeptidase/penicillin-binding protein PbpC